MTLALLVLWLTAASALEKKRFTNNWRVKPVDLKTAPTGLLARDLPLNPGQVEDIKKIKPNFDFQKDTLGLELLRSLSMTSDQLTKIGLKTDDQRRAAGIKDQKTLDILRITAEDLDKYVVSGLEMIIYPHDRPEDREPPHFAVLLTVDGLPQMYTDFGYQDSNKFKFMTLGSEPYRVVAKVTKVLAKKNTLKDFNKHLQRNIKMPESEIGGQRSCLSYAGEVVMYALGQCGVDGPADPKNPKDPSKVDCHDYGSDNVVYFLKNAHMDKNKKEWFTIGDGWTEPHFVNKGMGTPGHMTPPGSDDEDQLIDVSKL